MTQWQVREKMCFPRETYAHMIRGFAAHSCSNKVCCWKLTFLGIINIKCIIYFINTCLTALLSLLCLLHFIEILSASHPVATALMCSPTFGTCIWHQQTNQPKELDTTCASLQGLNPCFVLFFLYLAGKEMPTDFHEDLVVLVWSLVPRYDDLSARKVLQLVYLE